MRQGGRGSRASSSRRGAAAEPIDWTLPRAYARLLRRLGLSDLSRREALAYLTRKECPPELAEAAVEKAATAGLIDDARLGEALQAKASRVGWSQKQLQVKSRLKGLAEPAPIDESSACSQLSETWLRRGVTPERVAGRLARRGFNSRLVRATLKEHAQHIGGLEAGAAEEPPDAE